MPITLDQAQDFHPLMLTRQQNPDKEPLKGEFTLADLRSRFSLENGTEDEVLAEAAANGHAFFKSGDVYVGFAPKPGDSEDLPIEATEDPDTASLADHEIFDDAEDPDDQEIEVGELEMTIGHPMTAVAAEGIAADLAETVNRFAPTPDELAAADYDGDDLPEALYPADEPTDGDSVDF